MKFLSGLILFFLFFFSCKSIFAQKKYLYIVDEEKKTTKKVNIRREDERIFVREIVQKLENSGYLNAYFFQDTLSKKIYIYRGEKFTLKKILFCDTVSRNVFKIDENLSPHFENFSRKADAILRTHENSGYPFSSYTFQIKNIENEQVTAEFCFEKGTLIRFDSIRLLGDVRLKSKFLMRFLRLQKGELFSQAKIEAAEKIFSELNFLQENPTADLTFMYERAIATFSPKGGKSNSFDGFVGFQPNQYGEGLSFTGQISLELNNLFASAKSLSLLWNRVKPRSQVLQISYQHPQFLGIPLDLSLRFEQVKEDSLFSTVKRGFSFSHFRPQTGRFGFGFLLNTSGLLTQNVAFQPEKPLADGRLNLYSLSYSTRKSDNFAFPTRGYAISFEGKIGTKSLLRSPFADSILLQKLPENASYLEAKVDFFFYIPLRKRIIWHEKWQFAYLENDNLTQNDLFRLGGLKSLRGFNEMYFFAKNYLLHTSELRLLTEKQSYIFLFSDAVLLENFAGKEFAYGLGAGISLKMKSGIFNFVYAAGKSGEQSVGLRESKIHFGFISRF